MSVRKLRTAVKAGLSDAQLMAKYDTAPARVLYHVLNGAYPFAKTQGRYHEVRLTVRSRRLVRTRRWKQ